MSHLTLENLKKTGAFVGAPVEREIVWKQGEQEFSATVYVRKLSYLSVRADILASIGRTEQVAGRIAACICDPSGEPIFTTEDIVEGPPTKTDPETGEVLERMGPLDSSLTMALLDVIGEVNGLGKKSS